MPDNKFEMQIAPYMDDVVKELNLIVTIMKPVSTTVSTGHNLCQKFVIEKGVIHA